MTPLSSSRVRRVKLILPALTEATSPYWRPIKYSLFPPLGRKAAIVGEPQGGGVNCQLSASSGLPAISFPARFTDDGVPVGIELLGREWTEPRLLAIAFGYEQATHLRRAPPTTPPLVNGKAPAPRAFVVAAGPVKTAFTFDITTRRLKYDVMTMAGPDPAIAAAIHRATDNAANGPVVVRLLDGMGRPLSGDTTLGAVDLAALDHGKLYIEVTAKSGASTRAKIEPGG